MSIKSDWVVLPVVNGKCFPDLLICDKCGGVGEEEQLCMYAYENNRGQEVLCTCCNDCRERCEAEI